VQCGVRVVCFFVAYVLAKLFLPHGSKNFETKLLLHWRKDEKEKECFSLQC
jgi:hypothetical protein